MPTSADSPPLLALGMNSAPFNWPKREQIRQTMLRYPPATNGQIVFRFVVGRVLVPKPAARAAAAAGTSAAAGREPDLADESWQKRAVQLKAELASHADDMLQVDAIDGPGVAMECPAAEKTVLWVRHAVKTWPTAAYVGKTEDDTYLQLSALALELQRLSALRLPNVLYGLMGICSMPPPSRAARSASGHKACFLGSLERAGWVTGGYRSIAQWRGGGGRGARRGGAQCAAGSTAPAPFPTGPLMVASTELAAAVFVRCAYLADFERQGRLANRRTLCRGADRARSWASLVGDCAIGHWVSHCARGLNVTIAHMTYTKGHHYSTGAGGQGWVAPSNASVAVHWLKRHTGPSGPDGVEGGEWSHTHRAASAARGAGFPPLLWRYRPDQVLRSDRVLDEALNVPVHAWYAARCGVWHETLGAHVARLRTRLAQQGGGHGLNDSATSEPSEPRRRGGGAMRRRREGGDPSSWPFYGCHPSRGYAHPWWPPEAEPSQSG